MGLGALFGKVSVDTLSSFMSELHMVYYSFLRGFWRMQTKTRRQTMSYHKFYG